MSESAAPKTGARRVDETFWNDCLRYMREGKGNISYAATKLGADRKTVRRLWERGYPRAPWGKRPMRDVMAEDGAAAAARRAASAPPPPPGEGPTHIGVDVYEQARRDAIATRAEEARLLRAARANVQSLHAVTALVGTGALHLARRLQTFFSSRGEPGQQDLTIQQTMLILARYGNLVGKSTGLSEAIIAMEREIVGDPSRRLPDESSTRADNMTDAQAYAALRKAGDLAERIAKSGFAIIEGGQGETPAAPAETTTAPAETPGGDDETEPPDGETTP